MPHPRGPAFLYVRGGLPQEAFSAPATLRILVNESPFMEFTPEAGFIVARVLTEESLGTSPRTLLVFQTSATFVPARQGKGDDIRELGVMLEVLHLDEGIPPGFEQPGVEVDLKGFVRTAGESTAPEA